MPSRSTGLPSARWKNHRRRLLKWCQWSSRCSLRWSPCPYRRPRWCPHHCLHRRQNRFQYPCPCRWWSLRRPPPPCLCQPRRLHRCPYPHPRRLPCQCQHLLRHPLRRLRQPRPQRLHQRPRRLHRPLRRHPVPHRLRPRQHQPQRPVPRPPRRQRPQPRLHGHWPSRRWKNPLLSAPPRRPRVVVLRVAHLRQLAGPAVPASSTRTT